MTTYLVLLFRSCFLRYIHLIFCFYLPVSACMPGHQSERSLLYKWPPLSITHSLSRYDKPFTLFRVQQYFTWKPMDKGDIAITNKHFCQHWTKSIAFRKNWIIHAKCLPRAGNPIWKSDTKLGAECNIFVYTSRIFDNKLTLYSELLFSPYANVLFSYANANVVVNS